MLVACLLFCLGLFYGNFLEYIIHRYVFHKWGRKKGSIWSYHLKGHHRLAKKQGFVDLTESPVETLGLVALLFIHIPLWFVSIPMLIGVYLYAIAFSYLHGWQHKHPEFTQKYMKWHWDHHMGNPNKNYGVVAPWCDYLFGTRKKR